MEDGWEKRDPHDNGWYLEKPEGDRILFDEFPALAKFFSSHAIADAVDSHMKKPELLGDAGAFKR